MIFNIDEQLAISRTKVRKAKEMALIPSRNDLSEVRKSIICSHLQTDVERCILMEQVAQNDLYKIRDLYKLFRESPPFLPPELYQEYVSGIDEKARDEEGAFIFAVTYMLGYLDHIGSALDIADSLTDGEKLLTDDELMFLRETSHVLNRCSYYCRLGISGHDVPYDDALDYINTSLEECTMLINMNSDHITPIEMVSKHMMDSDEVDVEKFRQIMYPELSEHDREILDRFESEWERRVALLLGRCIADCHLMTIHQNVRGYVG